MMATATIQKPVDRARIGFGDVEVLAARQDTDAINAAAPILQQLIVGDQHARQPVQGLGRGQGVFKPEQQAAARCNAIACSQRTGYFQRMTQHQDRADRLADISGGIQP